MVDEDNLYLFKKWLDNRSFFGKNLYVLENIEFLFELLEIVNNKLSEINKYDKFGIVKLKEMQKEENLLFANSFFKSHGIELDVFELIRNGTLVLNDEKNNEKNKKYLEDVKINGQNLYENNQKVNYVYLENTILDACVIIHELTHFRNQSSEERNMTSDLLTEAISYGEELIFINDMDSCLIKEKYKLLLMFYRTVFVYSINLLPIYKIVYLYKIKNDITEEKYNEIFKDNDYKTNIEKFKKFTDLKENIFRYTWNILGLVLGTYSLMEYRKNKDFFVKLDLLNDLINEKSFEECLKIININGEFNIYIDKTLNEFKNFYFSIYEEILEESILSP